MKKILLLSVILICLTNNFSYGENFNTHNAEISKIETNLYGFDYPKDELKRRLERLEVSIYGKVQNGETVKRLNKIISDISANEIGLEIPPSEDTFREEENLADNTVNYPIVDEIEQKIFNKTFKERDFHTRIVTIERKLFGKIYDVEDYSKRMERIKAEVMPQTIAKEQEPTLKDYTDTGLNSLDLSSLSQSRYSSMPFGQRNYTRPYANYGDYNNQAPVNFDDELAQLEYDTFGTSFNDDDSNTRIKRLKSANKAKKSSSKYDSQKFQQRMSTAMEIGAMLLMILAMVL